MGNDNNPNGTPAVGVPPVGNVITPAFDILRAILAFIDKHIVPLPNWARTFIVIAMAVLFFIVVLNLFTAPTYIRGNFYVVPSKGADPQPPTRHQDSPLTAPDKVSPSNSAYMIKVNHVEKVHIGYYGELIIPIPSALHVYNEIEVFSEDTLQLLGSVKYIGPWPVVSIFKPGYLKIELHPYNPDYKDRVVIASTDSTDSVIPTLANLFEFAKDAYAASQDIYPVYAVVHLQNIGDVACSVIRWCGTKGESRRLEGFSLKQQGNAINARLQYMCHVEGSGDSIWIDEGEFCGTRGQSRRLEGIAIKLSGLDANQYNVLYQAHLQDSGDTPVSKNGDFVGTRGKALRLEAIQVWIQKK